MRTMTDKTYRALRRLVKELKLCIGCYNDSGESCGKCVQCLKQDGYQGWKYCGDDELGRRLVEKGWLPAEKT